MSSNNYSIEDVATNFKNTLIQVNTLLLISLTSLSIMLYIIYQLVMTIININKNYNRRVEDRNRNYNKNYKSSYNDDNYVYNKEDLKESQDYKNFNKAIIQNIKTNNEEVKSKFERLIDLKKKLNVDSKINSNIDISSLSANKDDLVYNKNKSTSFWSKLFFT